MRKQARTGAKGLLLLGEHDTSSDESEDDGGRKRAIEEDMNFEQAGKKISERLKKQGVVFRSQIDIVYTIEALER